MVIEAAKPVPEVADTRKPAGADDGNIPRSRTEKVTRDRIRLFR